MRNRYFKLTLLLKGYNDVHGVDVVKKFDNRILKHMNFNDASFNLINAKDTNLRQLI